MLIMCSVTEIDVLTVDVVALDELPGTRPEDRVITVILSLFYILLLIVLFLKLLDS
jgi:hypothetical protein